MDLPSFFKDIVIKEYGELVAGKIFEGYEAKKHVTLRANTLKSDVKKIKLNLTELGISFSEVSWNKDALILDNADENEIRKLEMYKCGEIYLQSLSSMMPVVALDPKSNENILDMASAPRRKNYTNGRNDKGRSDDYSL